MRQLFLFLHTYRAFFTFLVFEIVCVFLIVQNQNYHRAAFLNSSNVLVGSMVEKTTEISDYFQLKSQNQALSDKLDSLQELVVAMEARLDGGGGVATRLDTLYDYTSAKVINNSYRLLNNYLTLNKGSEDGLAPDQGVIGINGIVGKIRSVSDNFSIVVSLLHTDFLVSSLHKRSGTFCTTNWNGRNPEIANLLYVPRHVFLNPGDTITTSGYNSIFPPGQPIGIVEEINTPTNATFHEITIRLTTDFSQLNYISVVKNKRAVEKDSLELNAAPSIDP